MTDDDDDGGGRGHPQGHEGRVNAVGTAGPIKVDSRSLLAWERADCET